MFFSSNRFKTCDQLIITSSVTKDICIRHCILLIRCHMHCIRLKFGLFTSTFVLGNSFLNQNWWLKRLHVSKWKISELWTSLQSYLNTSKISVLIQITLCRNARIQMHLSKNNCFSAEKAKNYIPRTEKRKKVPVYEMFEFSWSLSFSMIPILSWKLKCIQRQLYNSSII